MFIKYTTEENKGYNNYYTELTTANGKPYKVEIVFKKDTPLPPTIEGKNGTKCFDVKSTDVKMFKAIVPMLSEKQVLIGKYEFTKILIAHTPDNNSNTASDDDLPF